MRKVLALFIFLLLPSSVWGLAATDIQYVTGTAGAFDRSNVPLPDLGIFTVSVKVTNSGSSSIFVPQGLIASAESFGLMVAPDGTSVHPNFGESIIRTAGGSTTSGWHEIPAGQIVSLRFNSFHIPEENGLLCYSLATFEWAPTPTAAQVQMLDLKGLNFSTDFINLRATFTTPEPLGLTSFAFATLFMLKRR